MDGTCAVRLTRYYRASPREVWAALTDPASIARWLAPLADADLSVGGVLRFDLDGGASLHATVTAVEQELLLELDWVAPGEQRSVVRFELTPDGEGTALALDHRLLEARLGMRAMGIWETHVRRLDALLGEETP